MIGCLMVVPIVGFLAMLGLYMSTLMAYFVGLATAMGIYMSCVAAYFTAFLIIMFG